MALVGDGVKFLPQFVDPSRGSAPTQILVLGLIFFGMAIVSDSVYALLAGSIGQWLKSSMRVVRGQRYVAGAVYITLGVSIAASSAIPSK
ncbi:MAG: LysE family translocator [bacterium]